MKPHRLCIVISVFLVLTLGLVRGAFSGVNVWSSLKGPQGGYVTSMIFDDAANTLYAGTHGGDVFSATNGGEWSPVADNAGLTNLTVNALAFNPEGKTIYAGTYNGVFSSTNGGGWVLVGGRFIGAPALVLERSNNTLYAGTWNRGVFSSTNGGDWSPLPSQPSDRNIRALAFGPENILYAVTSTAVFAYNTATGGAWSKVANGAGLPLPSGLTWAVAINQTNNTIYVGSEQGVFSSTNGGTWSKVANNAGVTAIYALAFDQSNNTLYAGTWGSGVFSSQNGGAWSEVAPNQEIDYVTSLIFNPRDNSLYAGVLYKGVYSLTNGNWVAVANPSSLTSPYVTSPIAFDPQTNTTYIGTFDGVFASVNGIDWMPVAGNNGLGSKFVPALLFDPSTRILYAGVDGGIFSYKEGDASWSEVTANIQEFANAIVFSLATDQAGSTLWAGTDRGAFLRLLNGVWSNTGLSDTSVISIIVSQEGRVYAGTKKGVYSYQNSTWSPVSNSEQVINSNVYSIVSDANRKTLYAGMGTGVYQSVDGGDWTAVADSTLAIGKTVYAIALDSQTNTLYAGTFGGIFSCRNGWKWLTFPRPTPMISALMFDQTTNTLYAGTFGRGVFFNPMKWTTVAGNRGLVNTNIYGLAFDPDDRRLYVAEFGGASYSYYEGEWSAIDGRSLPPRGNHDFAIDPANNTIYIGTASGVISSQNGDAWAYVADSASLTNPDIWSLTFDSASHTLYAGTSTGGVFSYTGGGEWKAVADSEQAIGVIVYQLLFDSRRNILYAGTYSGGVFSSTNGGQWSKVAGNAGLTNPYVYALALDPDRNTIYAGTWGNGVFSSQNGGEWSPVSDSAEVLGATDTLAFDQTNNTLYAGVYGSVFSSTDGGKWLRVARNNGFVNKQIFTLAFDPVEKTLYAGTLGSGVFFIRSPVVISPVGYNFGDQLINKSASLKFTVTINPGSNAPTTFGAPSLPPDAGEFSIRNDTCSNQVIAQDRTCQFDVVFTPTALGARSTRVTLPHDSFGSPLVLSLTGNGVVPGVDLKPARVDFADVAVGEVSQPQDVVVTNTGTGVLTLDTIYSSSLGPTDLPVSGDFAVSDTCLTGGQATQIQVGAGCKISVTFRPTTTGAKSGQVTIGDDTPSGQHTIPLTGKGIVLCGNGAIDRNEACDGTNFNGQNCQSLGFAGGGLTCGATCQFDTSGCQAPVAPPQLEQPPTGETEGPKTGEPAQSGGGCSLVF